MEFNSSNYADFEEEDFISDPLFQEWVIHPSTKKDRFWNEFTAQYPLKKDTVTKARQLLQSLSFKEHLPGDDMVKASLEKQLAIINGLEKTTELTITRRSFFFRNAWKIAAVWIGALALVAALIIYTRKESNSVYQTAYGEMKQIILPDSSLITLNANSSIEFNEHWKKDKPREVWLNGEGYFNVRHLNKDRHRILENERFLVHTKDLNIEVLGTSFDIRQRRGKTEVVLETGSIAVTFNDGKQQPINMKPGDIFTYHPTEHLLIKDSVSAGDYTAWKQKKLILRNPTIREITTYLEDNFGKKIIVKDEKMYNRKIEGPILFDNLDDALFILSTVLNTDIIKQDSTITLRPR